MNGFKLNTSKQLLAVAMGFVFSASAMAAVTSAPTATVKGRLPTMTPPLVNFTDADGNGSVNVGDTLTSVEGTFDDLDGDAQILSVFSWKLDGAEVATTPTYIIQPGDNGKKITLEIQPRTDASITDPAEGLAVASSGGTADPDGNGEIDIPVNGTVLAVAVDGYVGGAPQVGTPLNAIATCEGGSCNTLTYQWQIETNIGSGTYTDIANATSSSYTPVKDDQKRMIQVVVDN